MSDYTTKYSEITFKDIQSFRGEYPKRLWLLLLVEILGRFCFYAMCGILTILMVYQLFMLGCEALLRYGASQLFMYIFIFLGGIFADKILELKKNNIFFGGALLTIGGNALLY